MQLRNLLSLSIIVAGVNAMFASEAHATSWVLVPFEDAVARASDIAIVKILSAKALIAKSPNNEFVCGVEYEAEVVRSFKGRRRKFSFISESERFFDKFSTSYFVVAHTTSDRRSEDQVKPFSAEKFEPSDPKDREFLQYCEPIRAAHNTHVGFREQRIFPVREWPETGELALQFVPGYVAALDGRKIRYIADSIGDQDPLCPSFNSALYHFEDIERTYLRNLE